MSGKVTLTACVMLECSYNTTGLVQLSELVDEFSRVVNNNMKPAFRIDLSLYKLV